MARPSISICILNYNYGRFLARAIDSALHQQPGGYELAEVIVIDDGSTDESMDVCKRYGDQVTVLQRPHEGFGAVLTAAIQAARGEWVAPLDADDWFTPCKLASVAPALTRDRFMLQHWEYVVDAAGQRLLAEPHSGGNTSTLVVRRQPALELLPISNEVFFHVFDLLGYGVKVSEPLVNYRLHGANMTDRTHPGVFQDYLQRVNLELAERLQKLTASPPQWAGSRHLKRLSWHFTALAYAHAREAAVQRHERRAALSALIKEFYAALPARQPMLLHWTGAKSAICMRPTAVLGARPPSTQSRTGGR